MTISFLDKEQIKKIIIGACVAGLGASITYLSDALSGIDWGVWGPIVTAVFSVLVNILRKLATKY